MSASDRPTLIPDGEHDTLVDLPRYDLPEDDDDTGHSSAILPGDILWPESETI
jgi:hypothetical protein